MKKVWEKIKDVSILMFGLGYALTWVFDKLANKLRFKNEKCKKFETAGLISYIIGLVNSIICLISSSSFSFIQLCLWED